MLGNGWGTDVSGYGDSLETGAGAWQMLDTPDTGGVCVGAEGCLLLWETGLEVTVPKILVATLDGRFWVLSKGAAVGWSGSALPILRTGVGQSPGTAGGCNGVPVMLVVLLLDILQAWFSVGKHLNL